MKNKDHFLPFIGETTDEFKEFIKSLNTLGVFGGQESLVALARENQVRIAVHQSSKPIWYIEPDTKKVKKDIHIAYHPTRLHYSSVRMKGDKNQAATNIVLKDQDSASSSTTKKGKRNDKKRKNLTKKVDQKDVAQTITI